jgi:dCMP deaminase
MVERPSKLKVCMNMAEAASALSHDTQTQVGALLVKNDSMAIVATGYNGFVRGAPDKDLPTTRPDKYEYIMHAEENIIAHCTRLGISSNNCTLICTLTPCARCMRLLWQCGITDIIAKDKYRDFDKLLGMRDIKILVSKTEDGFWRLKYTQ